MAEVFGSQKKTNQGLEKLSVTTWDGNRKTYATWKRELKYWMIKYNQDDDEQLQWLRKALPKNSFWSDQVKLSTSIEQAWKILDMECLSLARVYKTCKEALEFVGIINCRRIFWIDSQIVLSWLKICPRKFKPFVSDSWKRLTQKNFILLNQATTQPKGLCQKPWKTS